MQDIFIVLFIGMVMMLIALPSIMLGWLIVTSAWSSIRKILINFGMLKINEAELKRKADERYIGDLDSNVLRNQMREYDNRITSLYNYTQNTNRLAIDNHDDINEIEKLLVIHHETLEKIEKHLKAVEYHVGDVQEKQRMIMSV